MSKQSLHAKSFSLGPVYVVLGYGFAHDLHWDWVADNGDKHTDIVALCLVKRGTYPRALRLTLGPVVLMVAIGAT